MSSAGPRTGAKIHGAFIDAVTWDGAFEKIAAWVAARQSRYICACNVHAVVTSADDPLLKAALDGADLAVPDGVPLVFALRRLGYPEQHRLFGPDLMWKAMGWAEAHGRSAYFFGSTPETLAALLARVGAAFPRLRIAGSLSPPFRPADAVYDPAEAAAIDASGADLLFVGLGCPKQEIWMKAARGVVTATMFGVGAAFDYHAGSLSRAPEWLQRAGLEWTYRLAQEPGRLWRRYLFTNSRFLLWGMRNLWGRAS